MLYPVPSGIWCYNYLVRAWVGWCYSFPGFKNDFGSIWFYLAVNRKPVCFPEMEFDLYDHEVAAPSKSVYICFEQFTS